MAAYRCEINIAHSADIIQLASYNARTILKNEKTGKSAINDWGKEKAEQWIAGDVELPEGVPYELKDKNKLWNTLNKLERNKNGQVARSWFLNLPKELSPEEWKQMVKWLAVILAKKGMIVQWDIHNKSTNPHAHLLTSMRKYDTKKGRFLPKTKEYLVCKNINNGNKKKFKNKTEMDKWNKQNPEDQYERIPVLDKNGKQKYKLKKGKYKDYQWVKDTVDTTGWNTRDNIVEWRELWDEIGNRTLENAGLDVRWTCKSYKQLAKEQGLPGYLALEPQEKLGPKAYYKEKKEQERCQAAGIPYYPVTDIGKENLKRKERNKEKLAFVKEIKESWKEAKQTIKNKWKMFLFKNKLFRAKPSLPRTLYSYYDRHTRCWCNHIEAISVKNLKNTLRELGWVEDEIGIFHKPAYAGVGNATVEETRAAAPSHNSVDSNKQTSEKSTKKKHYDTQPLNSDPISRNRNIPGSPGGDSYGHGAR